MSHWLYTQHCPLLYSDSTSPPPVPDNLPEGQEASFVRSYDDRLWLFQRRWIPKNDCFASLQILHGTVDHSNVYHELATCLNKAGIAVFCTDMRGWGLSDGESFYFHDINVFVQDVLSQSKAFHEERFANIQHRFLLGKSIGGLIAAYACAQQDDSPFCGLIGLSGAFEIEGAPTSTAKLTLLHTLSWMAPKLPFKPLMDSNVLVSDVVAQREWEQDDLVRRGRLTVAYIAEILKCTRNLPDLEHVPKLLLWGTDDPLVTLDGHKRLKSDTDILLTYPGGRHNLLQEPKLKDRVITDICDWILVHVKK